MQSAKKAATLTRRQLVAAGVMGGAAVAVGCYSNRSANWNFLSESQARTLAALSDQIIPADAFPSASQAGVLTYIDRQLVRHYRRHQNAYRRGLELADEISRQRFGREISALASPQQLEIVGALEQQDRAFFDLLRSHCMEGFYGSPRHGGNRDAVSWRMLGLAEPPLLGRAQYDLTTGRAS